MIKEKVILFGGNGFVGTHIAENLVEQGLIPVCISRSGTKPSHLDGDDWAAKAIWLAGDATQPDPDVYQDAEAIICLVGSPPVPTFSKAAYEQQLFANSQPNLGAILGAREAGVKRVVVLGAHLPNIIRRDSFGYARGKRLCVEAARSFSESDDTRSAVVLQPTAIFGTRYTANGRPIKLGAIMRPISKLQTITPPSMRQFLPEPLVSVQAVAKVATRAALDANYAGKFTVISNQQIATEECT